MGNLQPLSGHILLTLLRIYLDRYQIMIIELFAMVVQVWCTNYFCGTTIKAKYQNFINNDWKFVWKSTFIKICSVLVWKIHTHTHGTHAVYTSHVCTYVLCCVSCNKLLRNSQHIHWRQRRWTRSLWLLDHLIVICCPMVINMAYFIFSWCLYQWSRLYITIIYHIN